MRRTAHSGAPPHHTWAAEATPAVARMAIVLMIAFNVCVSWDNSKQSLMLLMAEYLRHALSL